MTPEEFRAGFDAKCERGELDAVIAETDKDRAEGRALTTLETVAAPDAPSAGENCAPLTGSAVRMARRDVINAISNAQERAIAHERPELAAAYYDAITVLLEHWQPDAPQNVKAEP